MSFELAQSVELRQLRRLRPAIGPLIDPPLVVRHGDEEISLASKEALLEHMMEKVEVDPDFGELLLTLGFRY